MNTQKQSLDINLLQSVSQDILDRARAYGVDQAEVSISASNGFSVSAHNGDVETVEYNQDKSIEITVYYGKKSGSAALSDLSSKAIQAAVEAAAHIAKFTDADEASGIADKALLAFDYPKLELAFPWHITVQDAIQLACQCEQEALSLDKRIMSAESVRIGTLSGHAVYANSHGFIGAFSDTHHEISCVLVAKQDEEMQREYSYTMAIDPSLLASVSEVAKEAVDRTVHRLGSRRIATTKVPVIFQAEEARSLLSHFTAAIHGSSLFRKSSFLLDHLGKQIFPSFVHIEEQPHLAKAYGSKPFDDDGVLTRNNVFIRDGVLQSYSLGVYSARKLNMQTTGNAGGVHNLIIQPGDKSFWDLVKMMDRGLLITELMGQGVNLITGDYSRGASGYWVENGKIQFPVHEITVAGNLQQMFQHILAVGNDIDVRGNIRTGSILIEEMMIAGN